MLCPAVYRSLQEHGKQKQALYPEVVTPLICVLWVSRQGVLIPAEPPVIPRDLLSPQADDRFTLGEVEAQDRLLTREAVSAWSEQEATALIEGDGAEAHEKIWQAYYRVSRRLFEQLIDLARLKTSFESLGEARLLKVEPQAKGAARHILGLYDWLGATPRALPLLERYALPRPEEGYRPCIEALARLDARLGHANTAYPLARAQRDALAQAMAMDEGEILAVNGPPGTGKTTFVLSVVASLWVRAAIKEAEPPLIVAASTNNQAVTNILAAFAKDFEEGDGPLDGRWLPEIDSYGGFYPARSREDEAAKEYQTPAFYRRLERPEYLEGAEGEFLARARAAFDDDDALKDVPSVRRHLHGELLAIRDRLVDIQHRWAKLSDLSERLGEDAEARQQDARQALEALGEERGAIEEALRQWKRFCADESLWLSVLSVLPPIARRRRLKRELFIDESLEDRARAIIHEAAQKSPEAALQAWLDKCQARTERLGRDIEARQALLEERAAEAARLRALLPAGADPDSLDAIDKSLDTSLRFSLFRLAVHYWEARWLEECRTQARQLAEEAKGSEKTGLKAVRPRWRRRMKLTPCIVSTLHSLPGHMTHSVYEGPDRYRQEYLENEIDLLIIDEAGQVAPEVAGASFALAKRALVIGDVHQIKPVSTQVEAVDVGNLRHQGVLGAVEDYDELRDTGRSVVDGSVMRIAQLASRYRYLEEAEPGMFLQEHRRCLNAIIAYCNDQNARQTPYF